MSLEAALDKYPNADIYVTLAEQTKYEIFAWFVKSRIVDIDRVINYEAVVERLSCNYLESCMVISHNSIRFCCSDFGKNTSPGVEFSGNYNNVYKEFLELREDIISKLSKGYDNPCKGCPNLSLMWVAEKHNLRTLIDSAKGICNFKCIYCDFESRKTANTSEPEFTKILNVIKQHNNAERLWINIARGEVTIHPKKEEIYDAIDTIPVLFDTNALIHDTRIHNKLIDGSGSICVSLDAGVSETYAKVKGLDLYDKVTDNLRKYNDGCKGEIYLKYIFLPGINENNADVDGFIDLCNELNVKRVAISHNLRLKFEDYNNTQTVQAATRMLKKLKEHSISCDLYSKDIIGSITNLEEWDLNAI